MAKPLEGFLLHAGDLLIIDIGMLDKSILLITADIYLIQRVKNRYETPSLKGISYLNLKSFDKNEIGWISLTDAVFREGKQIFPLVTEE